MKCPLYCWSTFLPSPSSLFSFIIDILICLPEVFLHLFVILFSIFSAGNLWLCHSTFSSILGFLPRSSVEPHKTSCSSLLQMAGNGDRSANHHTLIETDLWELTRKSYVIIPFCQGIPHSTCGFLIGDHQHLAYSSHLAHLVQCRWGWGPFFYNDSPLSSCTVFLTSCSLSHSWLARSSPDIFPIPLMVEDQLSLLGRSKLRGCKD